MGATFDTHRHQHPAAFAAMKKTLLLLASHAGVLAIGFALGIYVLPILTAPVAPTQA